jgi:hypothetical protein
MESGWATLWWNRLAIYVHLLVLKREFRSDVKSVYNDRLGDVQSAGYAVFAQQHAATRSDGSRIEPHIAISPSATYDTRSKHG